MIHFVLHFIIKIMTELPYAIVGYGALHTSIHFLNPVNRLVKTEMDKIVLAHSREKHRDTLLHCTQGECINLEAVESIDSYA